jgi:hypothetical protein
MPDGEQRRGRLRNLKLQGVVMGANLVKCAGHVRPSYLISSALLNDQIALCILSLDAGTAHKSI